MHSRFSLAVFLSVFMVHGSASSRSLPYDKYKESLSPNQPKTTPKRSSSYGKSRLGLKLSLGGGGGLATTTGVGLGLNGAFGFYWDHVAIQLGANAVSAKEKSISGTFLELEIYERSRRKKSMDTYWILGAGLGSERDLESTGVGPAVMAGFGVNLVGGETKFGGGGGGISVISFDGIEPYFALHARFPVMAVVSPKGIGLAASAVLVVEIAYQ